MKKYAIILPAIGLTLGTLHAQTVPLFINYQGKVTGGSGIPLGSTGTAPNFTAAPINRKVIFRIYDAPTAGNRLWSEQQTVTISLGEFSVLLGQGTASVYDNITEARPALDSIFKTPGAVTPAGPLRYLEVVVDDGSGTFTSAADVPITPRQRINSTAYSFRAAMADTVADASIGAASLAAGSVTAAKIVDSAITTEKLADLGILTEDIANNAINAAKIADGSIINAKIANGAVNAAKLDPTIGVWTVTGANVYRPAGSVGIGKVPATALDVLGAIAATGNITAGGAITATGAITGSSITTTGPFSATVITATGGVKVNGGNVLELGADVAGKEFSAGKIGYQTYSGNSLDIVGAGTTGTNRKIKLWAEGGTEINGRVGIGTAGPVVPLDVRTEVSITMTDNGYNSGSWPQVNPTTRTATGTYNPANPLTIEVYGEAGAAHLEGWPNAIAPVSIRSEGWIASAKGIIVFSDRRIKRDARESETARDLATIQKLKVTDYRMVDPSGDGMAWRKGFIAQEVEEVIPGAVKRSVEFVPDIFSVATNLQWSPGAKTLLVTLGKDHGLKVGDRVRLHADGSRLELDVSAVPGARQFVVDQCERAPEKVLVYGRQVNDFRTVDYDRIYTTSVGALQELKKEKDAEVKSLREENAALRTRLAALEADGKTRDVKLAALEANDKNRDAKLAEIQTLLLSSGKAGVRTVSAKAGK
jgi:hypothetical protein